MAAVRPPARFHRGWIHWVMYTLGGGLWPCSGCTLRCKHKREDVKSTFISHDLSSAANFHSALWNRGELPAAFKPSVCSLQESDRVDVMCVQMRELLAYFRSVMRISYYEVRFKGLSMNFKAEILQKGVILKLQQTKVCCSPAEPDTWCNRGHLHGLSEDKC